MEWDGTRTKGNGQRWVMRGRKQEACSGGHDDGVIEPMRCAMVSNGDDQVMVMVIIFD